MIRLRWAAFAYMLIGLAFFIAAAFALTASAASAATIGGCEMTAAENGNYFFKADNACTFTGVNLSDAFGAKGVTDK